MVCFNVIKPPKCYKQVETIGSGVTLNFWAYGDVDWVRIADPSDGLIGYYLGYYIEFKDLEGDKVWQALAEYKVNHKFIMENDIQFQEIPKGTKSWCLGYENLFEICPFSIRYLLHALIAAHKLVFYTIDEALQILEILSGIPEAQAVDILEHMFERRIEKLPVEWILNQIKKNTYVDLKDFDDSDMVRRVFVTPLRICPQVPELDRTNRIIRENLPLKDRFIRVNFVGENYGSVFAEKSDEIIARLRDVVTNGLIVGGEKFEFLAYSNSQLREQSAWFYNANNASKSAQHIRADMGDLSNIRIVGKHASRLALGFTSSTETIDFLESEVLELHDIERNGFCFSDGVGMISKQKAYEVSQILDDSSLITPSAFQIRYQGCKGVVGVAPDNVLPKGKHLAIRKSMKKFPGNPEHTKLEVVSIARPIRCYLNRQVISLLSALGIKDCHFMNTLNDMITYLEQCMIDNQMAQDLVYLNCGKNFIYSMLKVGFNVTSDIFLNECIKILRNNLLKDIRVRARILVEKGITLMGIMDETHKLPSGTIFFQYRDMNNNIRKLPDGRCVAVFRNPSLHPGDIRILTTMTIPELTHLCNVAVFPSQGGRPHPNEMSGGDLDGDIYSIIFDENLVPLLHETPMDFTAAQSQQLNRDITIEDIKDFFVSYIENDNLGIICNAHVAHADEGGANTLICKQLAKLASTAVDFAKTGAPAKMPNELKPKKYPHFMEKNYSQTYKSTKILGQIYDRVTMNTYMEEFGNRPILDESLLVAGWKEYLEEAYDLLYYYIDDLWKLMCQFEIQTEAELFSEQIQNISNKLGNDKLGDNEVKFKMNIKKFKEEWGEEFWAPLKLHEDKEKLKRHKNSSALKKASAWYYVSYTQEVENPFLSFAFIPYKCLCYIKKQNKM
uniref:RNA-dependent RNA polymerase n=1 Tax=Arcella intermedia TaxID=1963864 RepID=A0A6B2KXD6_9EUKA